MYNQNAHKNTQLTDSNTQLSSSQITVRKATANDLQRLTSMSIRFTNGYNNAGDSAKVRTREEWNAYWSNSKLTDLTYVAVCGQDVVGFVLCEPARTNETIVNIVFVEKDHRSKGVSSMLYKAAIEMLNARGISLTYARVLKNLPYWESLGFQSVTPAFGQTFTMRSLCILQMESATISSLNAPLENMKIRHFMNSMQRNMIDYHSHTKLVA